MKKFLSFLFVIFTCSAVFAQYPPEMAGDQFDGSMDVAMWLWEYEVPYSIAGGIPLIYHYNSVYNHPESEGAIVVEDHGVYSNAGIWLGLPVQPGPVYFDWDEHAEAYVRVEAANGLDMIVTVWTWDEVSGIWERRHGTLMYTGSPPQFWEFQTSPFAMWRSEPIPGWRGVETPEAKK